MFPKLGDRRAHVPRILVEAFMKSSQVFLVDMGNHVIRGGRCISCRVHKTLFAIK